MYNIKNKVFDFIEKHNMLDSTVETVYVATSGGADSMALLAFMHEYEIKFGIRVRAVHVNHGIRDITADRDENFVKSYCEQNNIPFISFNARKEGIVIPENASEDWARQLRYNYFSELVTGPEIKIATAHTLSDQAETVILRLSRGCGLNGMTGIPPVRESFLRPFLCLTRAEIEQLVEFYGTGNITDESNLTDDYARNKIRHHVVPVMKAINPEAEVAVGKICNRIENAYKYIRKVAEAELKKYSKNEFMCETKGFVDNDEVICDEMIAIFLEKNGCLNENYINIIKKALKSYKESEAEEEIYEFRLGESSVKRSILITNKYVSINVCDIPNIPLQKGINYFGYMGHMINVVEVSREDFENDTKDKKNLAFYADADKIDFDSLFIGSRVYGEKFKPACKSKNKVVNVLRVYPLCERGCIPIIKDGESLIYVWGIGFTDGYTPSENTKKIYKFVSM